ncbi:MULTISPECIES: hypothetical protein [Halocynthiibacter]|uniref:NnrT protein n=1 Tax=Halocynthiibacter halioticoli TaxID=2986804 RepID=A0AAE3LSF5_9RHOB|nr:MULTISPECIES: hypothetical protein [Halocynthiibacter]MCV6823376.1 hypothetical protein [Halocynthiibacter halioticoli]MCW4056377.1 hypothetical protein [Halocynthiibacter sp. SDUM655004]MDE0590657.1 hypothetical protein [Halocynthiibacter sp. C4]
MSTDTSRIWPLWKFAVVFYPFASTAAAINIFMVFLLLQALGIVAISPVVALIFGLVTGPYFSWLAAKWIRGLIMEAERKPG